MALLYRRTEAGRKAWDNQNSNVPLEYRRVLGLFAQDTDPREVRAKLGWSEGALNDILEELEEKGMLERYETDDRVDLDFTGSFQRRGARSGARTRLSAGVRTRLSAQPSSSPIVVGSSGFTM